MIVRAFDDTYVAEHSLRRKKSGLLVEDGAEELVSRAKALHQHIAVTVVNQLDSLGHSLKLNRLVNDVEQLHVDVVLIASLFDQLLVTDKSNLNETHLGRLGASLDRVLVNSPGCHHSFANAFLLEFSEYVSEFCDHNIFSLNQLFNYSSMLCTRCMVSRAMTSSSSVVTRATFTFESGREIIVSTPHAVLAS